jgi:hypothetical protein
MITIETYFGAMSHLAEPDALQRANASDLLARVGALLAEPEFLGIDAAQNPRQNSGWRTPLYNAGVKGAAKNSKHMSAQAIDLDDDDGALDEFLNSDRGRELLTRHCLWMEHPAATKGWCHLQSIPPPSGNRVFYP